MSHGETLLSAMCDERRREVVVDVVAKSEGGKCEACMKMSTRCSHVIILRHNHPLASMRERKIGQMEIVETHR